MKFWHTILLALGLSGAFLFVIYRGASAASDERQAVDVKMPYQIIEQFNDGSAGKTYTGLSDKTKLREIADDLDAATYPEDKLSDFPGFRDFYGQRITLYRAPAYIIYDQNKQTTYRSFATTVGELLSEKKIELGEDDKINFSADTELFKDISIKITRVAKTRVIQKENIDYKVLKKDDPNLKYGLTRTSPGSEGEKQLTFMVTRTNGEETDRVLLESAIVKQPVDEIIYTGTKVVVLSSVRGKATIGKDYCNVVSANYPKGTTVRITNLANGVKFIEKVDCTWGLASAPEGVVLDLPMRNQTRLKWDGRGAGPNVLVEEIEQ